MALVTNRKAGFNYEIIDKKEAGISLQGSEVKSLKAGHGSLDGSYATIRNAEVFLVGATIPPHQPSNAPATYIPTRQRKLLLNKKEIASLAMSLKSGLTIVPLSLYQKGRKIKCELALARGKKRLDKRESIKKREAEREIRRTLKNY